MPIIDDIYQKKQKDEPLTTFTEPNKVSQIYTFLMIISGNNGATCSERTIDDGFTITEDMIRTNISILPQPPFNQYYRDKFNNIIEYTLDMKINFYKKYFIEDSTQIFFIQYIIKTMLHLDIHDYQGNDFIKLLDVNGNEDYVYSIFEKGLASYKTFLSYIKYLTEGPRRVPPRLPFYRKQINILNSQLLVHMLIYKMEHLTSKDPCKLNLINHRVLVEKTLLRLHNVKGYDDYHIFLNLLNYEKDRPYEKVEKFIVDNNISCDCGGILIPPLSCCSYTTRKVKQFDNPSYFDFICMNCYLIFEVKSGTGPKDMFGAGFNTSLDVLISDDYRKVLNKKKLIVYDRNNYLMCTFKEFYYLASILRNKIYIEPSMHQIFFKAHGGSRSDGRMNISFNKNLFKPIHTSGNITKYIYNPERIDEIENDIEDKDYINNGIQYHNFYKIITILIKFKISNSEILKIPAMDENIIYYFILNYILSIEAKDQMLTDDIVQNKVRTHMSMLNTLSRQYFNYILEYPSEEIILDNIISYITENTEIIVDEYISSFILHYIIDNQQANPPPAPRRQQKYPPLTNQSGNMKTKYLKYKTKYLKLKKNI